MQAQYECLRNPQFYLDTLFLRKDEDTQIEMTQVRTIDFDFGFGFGFCYLHFVTVNPRFSSI